MGRASSPPCILGGPSDPPRIYESQTSKISVPDLKLADRTFRARVLKNKHARVKTQNTRVLLFIFYTDVRAPCGHAVLDYSMYIRY